VRANMEISSADKWFRRGQLDGLQESQECERFECRPWTGQAPGSNVWVISGEHMSGGHIHYNRGAPERPPIIQAISVLRSAA